MVIPFTYELSDFRIEVDFGFKVDDSQALPLENREPLFNLIHPRTMHGREVHNKAPMGG